MVKWDYIREDLPVRKKEIYQGYEIKPVGLWYIVYKIGSNLALWEGETISEAKKWIESNN